MKKLPASMPPVTILPVREQAGLDAEALERLFDELGAAAAEDVVCRAMEELALKLAQSERLYRAGEAAKLRKAVRSLAAIAGQIGMVILAKVAGDLVSCIDQRDDIALAAVLQRLLRMGEASITEIWQLQDITI